jgi:hypothetical protein
MTNTVNPMGKYNTFSGLINIGFNLLFGAPTLMITIIFAYEPMIASVLFVLFFVMGSLGLDIAPAPAPPAPDPVKSALP